MKFSVQLLYQESLRTLITIIQQRGVKLHQVDVDTAFLNKLLEEEVYTQQPQGFFKQGGMWAQHKYLT